MELDDYSIDVGDGSQWKRNIPSSLEYLETLNRVEEQRNAISNNITAISNRQLIQSRRYVKKLRELPK
jgi:hypothetical protein